MESQQFPALDFPSQHSWKPRFKTIKTIQTIKTMIKIRAPDVVFLSYVSFMGLGQWCYTILPSQIQ